MATLWILAALAVLAAYVNAVAEANVAQATGIKRAIDEDLALRSAEATLLYLLATNRMNHRGLLLEAEQRFAELSPDDLPPVGDGEFWMNGSVYQGLDGIRFAAQDEYGLVSINRPEAPPFAALLRWVGVGLADRSRFVGRIKDYVDTDHELTLGGAERLAYRRAGRMPPANWIMATPVEMQRVLGVDGMLAAPQQRALLPLLTSRPLAGYNFNTMPLEVAAAVLEVDREAAKAVVDQRLVQPVWRSLQLRELTGSAVDVPDDQILRLPSSFVRLMLWRPGRGGRWLVGLEMTPYGESAPWRRDYQYWEPVAGHDAEEPPRLATALL
ncbi:MAG: type II secretion system protein GspK [Gammaproteobacteria bacterium]|nr:type II secretion system protein GspK [Gammaproteobacteria bacterium]